MIFRVLKKVGEILSLKPWKKLAKDGNLITIEEISWNGAELEVVEGVRDLTVVASPGLGCDNEK